MQEYAVFLWPELSLLLGPSSLCLLHDRPMNPRDEVSSLFGKLVDGEDGKLMFENNHLVGPWMSGSFMDQRWGEVREQNIKTI